MTAVEGDRELPWRCSGEKAPGARISKVALRAASRPLWTRLSAPALTPCLAWSPTPPRYTRHDASSPSTLRLRLGRTRACGLERQVGLYHHLWLFGVALEYRLRCRVARGCGYERWMTSASVCCQYVFVRGQQKSSKMEEKQARHASSTSRMVRITAVLRDHFPSTRFHACFETDRLEAARSRSL